MNGVEEVRGTKIARIVGALLILISLWLPGVYRHEVPGWGGAGGPQNGLTCVLLAPLFGIEALDRSKVPVERLGWLFVGISGFTNPMLLAYVAASKARRRHLSIAVVLALLATVPAFLGTGARPLFGYFLWATGILAVLAPELGKGESVWKSAD